MNDMSDKRERLLVVAGVVVRGDRIMLCQRRPEVHNGLKWEFPGGKLEPGESPEAALRRELREELSIDVRVGRIVDAVYHRYPDRDVSDRVVFMDGGVIVESDVPEVVFTRPKHPRTREFLARILNQ